MCVCVNGGNGVAVWVLVVKLMKWKLITDFHANDTHINRMIRMECSITSIWVSSFYTLLSFVWSGARGRVRLLSYFLLLLRCLCMRCHLRRPLLKFCKHTHTHTCMYTEGGNGARNLGERKTSMLIQNTLTSVANIRTANEKFPKINHNFGMQRTIYLLLSISYFAQSVERDRTLARSLAHPLGSIFAIVI